MIDTQPVQIRILDKRANIPRYHSAKVPILLIEALTPGEDAYLVNPFLPVKTHQIAMHGKACGFELVV